MRLRQGGLGAPALERGLDAFDTGKEIAGAPRTTISRIALATSAAVRQVR